MIYIPPKKRVEVKLLVKGKDMYTDTRVIECNEFTINEGTLAFFVSGALTQAYRNWLEMKVLPNEPTETPK